MNLFYLAEYYLQVIKGKIPEDKNYNQNVITTAVIIRKWLDIALRNTKISLNREEAKRLLKENTIIKR